MNPVIDVDAEVYCEWPVRSPFWDQADRTCGRAGYGSRIRLCWQHREAIHAAVINDLYETPDGRLSRMLADWVETTFPTETDSPKQAEQRAESFRYAALAVRRTVENLGKTALDELCDAFSPLVDELIRTRLAEKWGAA